MQLVKVNRRKVLFGYFVPLIISTAAFSAFGVLIIINWFQHYQEHHSMGISLHAGYALVLCMPILCCVAPWLLGQRNRIVWSDFIRVEDDKVVFVSQKTEYPLELDACELIIDPKGFRLFLKQSQGRLEFIFPKDIFDESEYETLQKTLSTHFFHKSNKESEM